MFAIMRAWLLIAVLVLFAGLSSHAQECPRDDPSGPSVASIPRVLHGEVLFHDDLRQWLSLELEAPVCGQRTIEIFLPNGEKDPVGHLETFRGCKVTTSGVLDIPSTGYYSAEIYQTVTKITPDSDCIQQPAFPDFSKIRPNPDVRSYRVSMWFVYGAKQGSVHATITSNGRSYAPWQAYAHYWLTGGFVFYGFCADDFSMSHVTGTSAGNPGQTDEQASFDPETAAVKHVFHDRLSFNCTRITRRQRKQ